MTSDRISPDEMEQILLVEGAREVARRQRELGGIVYAEIVEALADEIEKLSKRMNAAERVIALAADPIDSPHLGEFDEAYATWRRSVYA